MPQPAMIRFAIAALITMGLGSLAGATLLGKSARSLSLEAKIPH